MKTALLGAGLAIISLVAMAPALLDEGDYVLKVKITGMS